MVCDYIVVPCLYNIYMSRSLTWFDWPAFSKLCRKSIVKKINAHFHPQGCLWPSNTAMFNVNPGNRCLHCKNKKKVVSTKKLILKYSFAYFIDLCVIHVHVMIVQKLLLKIQNKTFPDLDLVLNPDPSLKHNDKNKLSVHLESHVALFSRYGFVCSFDLLPMKTMTRYFVI